MAKKYYRVWSTQFYDGEITELYTPLNLGYELREVHTISGDGFNTFPGVLYILEKDDGNP